MPAEVIQSFALGEATPEQAHEIGRLADEVLRGKYPYVLTTHIDKGHVHNHIIFCAVDMVNCRKYVSNKQSYSFIRRTSDRLCREQGLSVVKPGQNRGQSYAEWDAQRRGRSWKAKLKIAIDARKLNGRKGLSLCIDIENSIKAQQSAIYYTRWAKIHNLQQTAKTMNFLPEHGIDAYPDLESRMAEISAASEEAAALKTAEWRLGEMAVLIKNLYSQEDRSVIE